MTNATVVRTNQNQNDIFLITITNYKNMTRTVRRFSHITHRQERRRTGNEELLYETLCMWRQISRDRLPEDAFTDNELTGMGGRPKIVGERGFLEFVFGNGPSAFNPSI